MKSKKEKGLLRQVRELCEDAINAFRPEDLELGDWCGSVGEEVVLVSVGVHLETYIMGFIDELAES